MPQIRRLEWERYAQLRSAGKKQGDAYEAVYGKKNQASASRLEQRPEVRERVAELMQAAGARFDLDRERICEEVARIAYGNIGDILRIQNDGTAIFDLSHVRPEAREDVTRIISEITTETYMEGGGEDAREVKRIRFKLYSKLDALKFAAQLLGLDGAGEKAPSDHIPLAERLRSYQVEAAIESSAGKVVGIRR